MPRPPVEHLQRAARVAGVAIAVAGVLLVSLGLPYWVFVVSPQRRARDERIAALPDSLFLTPAAATPAARAELDALIALPVDDPSLLLLRAADRLQAGDRAAAAGDLRRLTAAAPTPYVEAVAARYAAADDGAPALDDLPPPRQPIDHLVAGFHALRRGELQPARQQLQQAAGSAPAQRLLLLATMAERPNDADALAQAATRLEELRGHATSHTRHAQGRALLLRQQFEQAAELCRQALALRPGQADVLHDLAAAEFGLGQLPAAEQHLREALAAEPQRTDSQQLLQQVQRAQRGG